MSSDGFNDAILEPTATENWPGSPNQPSTYLHPDLIDVYRVVMGAVGLTGNPTRTVVKTQSQIPCYVAHAMDAGSDSFMFPSPTGELVAQTDACTLDGLSMAQCKAINPSFVAGDTLTYNGINYVAAYNARGAFLDIQPFDVAVRGTDVYLILRVSSYTDLLPSQLLHLAFGKAPADIPPPTPTPPSEINVKIAATVSIQVGTGAGDGLVVESGADIDFEGGYVNISAPVTFSNGATGTMMGGSEIFSGSPTSTILVDGSGASLNVGTSSDDAAEISIGNSGSLVVNGGLSISGTSTISIGNSVAANLAVNAGSALGVSGSTYIDLEGALRISSDVSPTAGAQISTNGGVLGNFTFTAVMLAVAFTDASYLDGSKGDITAWAWDFGDSIGTSTEQSPSYTYASGGTYVVTLTVTTSGGGVSQCQISITVT